jgi:hypothetical protein
MKVVISEKGALSGKKSYELLLWSQTEARKVWV